jgi:hypothetical protein
MTGLGDLLAPDLSESQTDFVAAAGFATLAFDSSGFESSAWKV